MANPLALNAHGGVLCPTSMVASPGSVAVSITFTAVAVCCERRSRALILVNWSPQRY